MTSRVMKIDNAGYSRYRPDKPSSTPGDSRCPGWFFHLRFGWTFTVSIIKILPFPLGIYIQRQKVCARALHAGLYACLSGLKIRGTRQICKGYKENCLWFDKVPTLFQQFQSHWLIWGLVVLMWHDQEKLVTFRQYSILTFQYNLLANCKSYILIHTPLQSDIQEIWAISWVSKQCKT